MDYLITAVFIFAFSIVVLSFIDLKLSVAFYIAYLILVPYLQFKIAGFPLSYNLVNTLLLAVFLYQSLIKKRYKLNYKVITPFLFLFFSLLVLSLFTWGMPWSIQFNNWRVSFMQTCILSFIVWNLAQTDKKILTYFKWGFMISIIIAGIYGLFLMQMGGMNPYTTFLSSYFGMEDMADHYIAKESRLSFSQASKIQATMVHPMTWALILCFSIITFTIFYLKTKDKKYWLLIGLVAFNILISGVRTGIAALILGITYFLIRYRKFKLILLSLIIIAALSLIIQANDDLSNLFASFTDVSGQKSTVKGSSITMRLEQLQGAIDEIKGHELPGKGFGWTRYYTSINERGHPVLLAFESLLFMVLCNSGYIGLFIWIIFFLLLFQLNRNILMKNIDIYLMDAFVIIYAAYSIGTGDYGYISFFAIFYSYLLGYLNRNQEHENYTNTTDL